ncbi:hypothetical protein Q5752_006794 [Cryptotrichosporon argae]
MMFASARTLIAPSLARSVVHHARPPRVPSLSSPHHPRAPLPTSGTSQPEPPHLVPSATPATSSAALDGTSLTIHHSPPPSEPSYTTGVKPDFLRWVEGGQVRLTGQEAAPVKRGRRAEGEGLEWSDEVVGRMREMRAQGMSRKRIAETLSIPTSQQHLIAREAPLSKAQAAAHVAGIEQEKAAWGPRKRLNREIREKRKEFW